MHTEIMKLASDLLTSVRLTWIVCEGGGIFHSIKVGDINDPWVGGILFHQTVGRITGWYQVFTSLSWSTSRASVGDCEECSTAQNNRQHGSVISYNIYRERI
jgi:hypothetical protein